MFKPYIPKEEQQAATKILPRLMTEGLLFGGAGLGVLALIFEIAADAFSVAAYQTLLAIHGANGNHEIAIIAFIALSVMLFFGIVPAYKAAAYLRPNTGGSGPLVESIGPKWLRKASWVGTSLFFMDAILTIIISSISAADVTMLVLPELVAYRILLAELYAFFIMAALTMLGPKRAVPIFLLGGGLFTIFTMIALSYVAFMATTAPELGLQTPIIVQRLVDTGVTPEIVHAAEGLGQVAFWQLLFRSMSSAMLGFSGYEMIPASGKHAAKPKWKVINTALTLAAVFLIGTGLMQLFAAKIWNIPATVGYSTLLIEYELVFGSSSSILSIAGILLAVILLLAQGGGYIGGAAVASTAARLGRMPRVFLDDSVGIGVIWLISAIFIPIIREVIVVEAYYAFGFVSAFAITGTTIAFVRDDALLSSGIEPESGEAKSLKFAGWRGMIASYVMMIVLVWQKFDALPAILIGAGLLTLFQFVVHRNGLKAVDIEASDFVHTGEGQLPLDKQRRVRPAYPSGTERALDEARQRGIVEVVRELFEEGKFIKYNIEAHRIRKLISHTYGISPHVWPDPNDTHHEHLPEPTSELEKMFQNALAQKGEIQKTVEHYSHIGIFTFIENFHINWISKDRDAESVKHTMIKILFINDDFNVVWEEYLEFTDWESYDDIKDRKLPEAIWQFSRRRYFWAKDQWPNLSDRITTIWTLQDLGIIKEKNADDIMARIGTVR